MKKSTRLLSIVLAMLMVISMMPVAVFATTGALNGSGTEADPYQIATVEDLILFRDSVNKGEAKYSAPGRYVELAANIDLGGINWIGIGSATADHGFMGNFDGKGYTVSNLTINNPTLDSDGYAYAGLFSVTEGTEDAENVIKNLKIENVTINTTGHIVSAAIAYPYYTKVENVTVCGNIAITGGNYTAGVLAYTRRCVNASNLTIAGNAGSFVKGGITVGGVISDIQMNGGLKADYSNFKASGLTITGELNVGGISGIISQQTLNGAEVKDVALVCSDARVGVISGSLGDISTITGVVAENVTGAANTIGATYDKGLEITVKIGDTYYADLESANAYEIDSVEDLIKFRDSINAGEGKYNNAYVILTADIDLSSVANWTPIGNVAYNSKYAPADSSKVFSGVFNGNNKVISNLKMSKTAGGADEEANLGLFGITGEGAVIKDLTITNVDIETDGRNVGALVAFGHKATIDNITVNGDIRIKGGNNVSGVCAMSRYYAASVTNITLKGNDGSTIVGNNIVGGIFAEIAPNGAAQTFKNLSVENVAISGVGGVGGLVGLLTIGTVENVSVKDVALTGRTDYQGNAMGRIRLGSVSGLMGGKNATIIGASVDNVTAKNLDGNAVVLPVIGANYDASSNATEAKIGDTYYATLEAALKVAKAGDTVELLTPIVVAQGETVEFDLKGITFVGVPTEAKAYAVVTNHGNLTIKDSVGGGKIVCDHKLAGSTAYAVNTIVNSGTLTIEGGVIENKSAASYQIGYAIDNNSTSYDAAVVIKGGEVKASGSNYYDAIRLFCNSMTKENSVTVEGGKVSTIWMQNPSDGSVKDTKDVKGSVTVSGGTVDGLYLEPSAEFEAAISGGYVGEVEYFTTSAGRDLKGFITGGTFGMDVSAFVADGYAVRESGSEYKVVYAPKLPTATVTELDNDELTFALNFKADEATDEQLAYYGDWYADFVLTVNKDVTFNANGGADGYLSGQYSAWSENWVNVPFEDVTLKAGESLKIMEYAAELMGESGLKLTYNDVYSFVKDFDCGVFFEKDFLLENPDIEVTLELRMYNPEDETENYAIGDTYVFTLDIDLPTATVKPVENDNLTFAMNFVADEINEYQLAYYKGWYADFELTVNKDTTFNANGGADGWLAGQYDEWSENWVNVPFEDVTLKANEPLKIMAYAAELMGEPGLKYTYGEVYDVVKDFDCGVFFDTEYILANPDLKVTLELRMYNPKDETESYVIGETYVFTLDQYVAINKETSKLYTTVAAGLAEAKAGETVMLLKDVVGDKKENYILVTPNTTLDLNGKALAADYVVGFNTSDVINSLEDTAGKLIVAKNNVTLDTNNAQLSIYDGKAYTFVNVNFTNRVRVNGTNVSHAAFLGSNKDIRFYAGDCMSAGYAASGVNVIIRVNWTSATYSATQDYKYKDVNVKDVYGSYFHVDGQGGNYRQMFTASFKAAEIDADAVSVSVVLVSDTGVELASEPISIGL